MRCFHTDWSVPNPWARTIVCSPEPRILMLWASSTIPIFLLFGMNELCVFFWSGVREEWLIWFCCWKETNSRERKRRGVTRATYVWYFFHLFFDKIGESAEMYIHVQFFMVWCDLMVGYIVWLSKYGAIMTQLWDKLKILGNEFFMSNFSIN